MGKSQAEETHREEPSGQDDDPEDLQAHDEPVHYKNQTPKAREQILETTQKTLESLEGLKELGEPSYTLSDTESDSTNELIALEERMNFQRIVVAMELLTE